MDFSEADHKNYRPEELKKMRKDILLLIYAFDPNYITKSGSNKLRYEPGDEKYINTDKGVLAMVMYLPGESRPKVKSWVNQTIQQSQG
jgi:hypothetical protein